ncbi:MAG: hypothetical protein P8M05_08975 [Flavobacteriales bacterium]|nr:hypothetical protein [Flavobacteriales bacterium]
MLNVVGNVPKETMKYLSAILFTLIIVSCSEQKNNGNHDLNELDKSFGERLIENNFLDFADTLNLEYLKKEISESFSIYEESIYKLVHIDAEELTEFNFDFFMPQLNKILAKRAFNLKIELTNDYESSNQIVINGQIIELYSNSELESGTFWDSGPRNFFKKVNDLLSNIESKERFYLLYGGNDLHTFLLTEDQYKIIEDRYGNGKIETPYLP